MSIMTREEYERKLKSLEKQRDELSKVIKRLFENLNTETGNVRNLETRIEKLKDESIKSLTGDERSFAKFKASLRRLNISLENSKEVCELLETIVIPKKQGELVEIKVAIDSLQDSYSKECEELRQKIIAQSKQNIGNQELSEELKQNIEDYKEKEVAINDRI